jgi:hypothetical protein
MAAAPPGPYSLDTDPVLFTVQACSLLTTDVQAGLAGLDQKARSLAPGSEISDKVDIGPVPCKRMRKALHETARALYPRLRLKYAKPPALWSQCLDSS